nr:hypothetical protein BaRGS_025761 [Batillaria attramentaria]
MRPAEKMSHLSLEERKLYAEAFLEMDKDGNGCLSKEELAADVLPKLGVRFPNEELIDKIFKDVDKNKDGKITLDEFLLICEKLDPTLRKRAFQTMDVNLDGQLTEEEFVNFIQDKGVPMNKEDVSNAFKKADKDKNGKLSFKEFLEAF